MDNQKEQNKRELTPLERHKRTKAIIIACFVAGVLLILICASVPGLLSTGGEGGERETLAPVDPDKLCDTKEEDFDIFEYEDYLRYDRTVYLDDPRTGVMISVSESEAGQQGKGFALLYDLLTALTEGDADAYNSLVADSLAVPTFTQQQLYDMVITRVSQETVQDKNGSYHQYVFTLEYKIRENNGSFKNNLSSDTSRPVTVVVNNSSGELKIVEIAEPVFITK